MKKILTFCKVSLKTAPLYLFINLLFLLLVATGGFLITLSFKYITNGLIACMETQTFGLQFILPFVLLFISHNIGGSMSDFNKLIVLKCTNGAKIFYNKIFMLKSYFEKHDSFYDKEFYDNYTIVSNHLESTTNISTILFNDLTMAVLSLMISITAITVFSPVVLLFMLLISLIMVAVNHYSIKMRVKIADNTISSERKASYYSSLIGTREHAKELRIFEQQDFLMSRWKESYREYASARVTTEKNISLLMGIPGIIQEILMGGINIYYYILILNSEMTVGDFTFLFGMMLTLMAQINKIVNIFTSDLAENYEYLDKYERFIGKVDGKTLSKMQDYQLGEFRLQLGPFETLSIENVYYRYPNQNRFALNGVNLKLRRGEVISIIGYNGSGKSTLSKVLSGILENYSGKIKLNNTDIRHMDKVNLFRYFGVAFQDYKRYSISLKDNIGIGMIERIKSEEEIYKAAKKANLQDIIQRLPYGLDTYLGKEFDENGQELSGGQWQKVALSRAYMGEPEIVIMDEPTASIDPLEEYNQLQQIKRNIQGKTAILISHRIGFARLSDRICVMDDGRIVEEGTHNELMRLKGHYYELFMSQQKLYERGEASSETTKRE